MPAKQRKQPNIFQPLEELLDRLVNDVTNFPKAFKFSIGDKTIQLCLELVSSVYRINRADSFKDKTAIMDKFDDDLDMLKMLIRFSNEKRFIPIKRQGRTAIVTEDITNQISAWRNYLEKRAGNGNNC